MKLRPIAFVSFAALAACTVAPSSVTHSSTTDTFECCLNGTGYLCPSQSALDRCAGFDQNLKPIGSPDPSACNATGKACGPAGVQPSDPGPGDACGSIQPTGSCYVDSDCGSGFHCASGGCYPNTVGSACYVDSDCGASAHCTSGCCQVDGSGSGCYVDSDCGPNGHCTGGQCYLGFSGDPCDVDDDCQSGVCVGGACK